MRGVCRRFEGVAGEAAADALRLREVGVWAIGSGEVTAVEALAPEVVRDMDSDEDSERLACSGQDGESRRSCFLCS